MSETNESQERADRRTLSASNEANTALDLLTAYGWFADGIEAYRVAIAVALSRGLTEEDVPERVNAQTKYNVGSVDPEGRLRNLIILLRPQDELRPYAAAEWLAEAGLHLIIRELDDGTLLSDIIEHDEVGASEL